MGTALLASSVCWMGALSETRGCLSRAGVLPHPPPDVYTRKGGWCFCLPSESLSLVAISSFQTQSSPYLRSRSEAWGELLVEQPLQGLQGWEGPDDFPGSGESRLISRNRNQKHSKQHRPELSTGHTPVANPRALPSMTCPGKDHWSNQPGPPTHPSDFHQTGAEQNPPCTR